MDHVCSLFAALSDPIRLRSLLLLAEEGELCVCELTHALQIAQPKMSRHLAALRDTGLVQDRRNAQWVYYTISPRLEPWAREALAAAVAGLAADPVHAEDAARLRTMAGRSARRNAA